MTTRHYRATVERDGRFWLIRIKGLGGATQARHLRELDTMARDYIISMTEAEHEDIDVEYVIRLPRTVEEHISNAERFRTEAGRASRQAVTEARLAARELRKLGLPLRDVGQVLGVSYQRAHQLISSSE